MNLFFAGGYGNSLEAGARDEQWLAEQQCSKRLVSFAEIDKRPGMYAVWVGARRRAMELFFAGAGGQAGSEPAAFEAGASNRLLSYNDAVANVIGGNKALEPFWITVRQLYLSGSKKEASEAMRLYLAGNTMGAPDQKVDHEAGVTNRLLTFADIDSWAKEAFLFWVENGPENASVFLDSGAFGASTRGAKIDLGRYCDYIKENAQALSCYAALDVIGDWRETAKNLDVMLAAGLTPVPTFHRGSPWEELDRLARDHKHIALGGIVTGGQFTQDALQPFMDEAFRRLEKHWPVKVHVFGVIAQWLLERYPLYSADSATAIVGGGMGRVMAFRNGQMRSVDWKTYLAETWDGSVADGVATNRAAKGSAHAGRRLQNIRAQLALEQHVTSLWAQRGVRWEEETTDKKECVNG